MWRKEGRTKKHLETDHGDKVRDNGEKPNMLYGMSRFLYLIQKTHTCPPSHGDKADDQQYSE